MKIRTAIILLSGLLIHGLSSAERPVGSEEDILVVGDRPTFGKLDGMDCVRLRIESTKNSEEVMYVSARPRNANDFTIGKRIFGIDDPVTRHAQLESLTESCLNRSIHRNHQRSIGHT